VAVDRVFGSGVRDIDRGGFRRPVTLSQRDTEYTGDGASGPFGDPVRIRGRDVLRHAVLAVSLDKRPASTASASRCRSLSGALAHAASSSGSSALAVRPGRADRWQQRLSPCQQSSPYYDHVRAAVAAVRAEPGELGHLQRVRILRG